MPFVRASRIPISTPSLDREEIEWWNEHADLIERIWGLSDALCREVRAGYIAEIRALFQKLVGRKKLHILEIACGSGWPGRLLADADTRVTGLDFSEKQIQLAREKATSAGATTCDYRCEDVNEIPALLASGGFDGSFIHCGIHHLSGDELRQAAGSLSAAPPGTPVILIEPMYHDRRTFLGAIAARIFDAAYGIFQKRVSSGLRIDDAVAAETSSLLDKADRASWFLSPKEMPFALPELEAVFGEAFVIEEVKIVTHYALRLGQFLTTLRDQKQADAIGAKWLPLLNRMDRSLIQAGLAARLTNQYFFTRIVLIRR
ncbi:MAG: class I SAM-dependent methyltransferase [Chthoniobacteraceae bacterium]